VKRRLAYELSVRKGALLGAEDASVHEKAVRDHINARAEARMHQRAKQATRPVKATTKIAGAQGSGVLWLDGRDRGLISSALRQQRQLGGPSAQRRGGGEQFLRESRELDCAAARGGAKLSKGHALGALRRGLAWIRAASTARRRGEGTCALVLTRALSPKRPYRPMRSARRLLRGSLCGCHVTAASQSPRRSKQQTAGR
jgi:hypothetical protein